MIFDEDLEHMMRYDLEEACWFEVAAARLGSGLAAGPPNLAPLKELKQKLIAEGNTTEASYVDKISCAGLYLGKRRQETWPEIEMQCQCPHCGQHHIERRVFWECPSLAGSLHPEVQATQHLVRRGSKQEQRRSKAFG